MSDGKIGKDNRKHLKNEIESLLSTISSENNESMLIDDALSNELQAESPYDFEKMSDDFTNKARDITDSLFKNFPDFEQKDTRIAVFGNTTVKAAKAAGLKCNIQAPTPETPSMTMALEKYIISANKK